MKDLIQNNDEGKKYMFILDSVDGLMTKGDSLKSMTEATKVAGGAVISSMLMKRISLALSKRGHMAIFISQVRSDIKLDPYAANKDIRQTTATGGNALLHFANWILEFEPKFGKDLILEKPNERYDQVKNKIIGHNVKIIIKKSTNETTNSNVQYPIKYGRKDGSSVWREYEIIDQILSWEFAVAKGAWVTFSDQTIEELKKVNLDLKKQHQGIDNLRSYLEENKPIIDGLETSFILDLENPNYIRDMRNTSTWGGAIEIQAASSIWNLRIIVKNYRNRGEKDIEFIPLSQNYQRTIEVYWTGGHYEPIR
jgi:hypothetical protein